MFPPKTNRYQDNDSDREDQNEGEHVPLTISFKECPSYSSLESQSPQRSSSLSLFNIDADSLIMSEVFSSSRHSDRGTDHHHNTSSKQAQQQLNSEIIIMEKLKGVSRMIKQNTHHLIHLKNTVTPSEAYINNNLQLDSDIETTTVAATKHQYNQSNGSSIRFYPTIGLSRISVHDLLVVHQLKDIPDHMLIYMCYYLSYDSLLQLRCVNQRMNRVSSHYELWVREAFRINLLSTHHRYFRAIYTFQFTEQERQKRSGECYLQFYPWISSPNDDGSSDADDDQRIMMDHIDSDVRELAIRLNHDNSMNHQSLTLINDDDGDHNVWPNDVDPTILKNLRTLKSIVHSEELSDNEMDQLLYLDCIRVLQEFSDDDDNGGGSSSSARDEGNSATREEALHLIRIFKRRRQEELEDGFNWDVVSLEHKLQLMHKIERFPLTYYYGQHNTDDDNPEDKKKVEVHTTEKRNELRGERRQMRRARLVQIMDKGKEMLNETDYRQLFIRELCKRGVVNVERTKSQSKYQKSIRLQVLYQALYGALCPLLFLIGLLTQIFIYPLYVDGKIAHTTLNHAFTFLPFALLSIPSYFIFLSGLLTDPYLLNRYKQKWFDRTNRFEINVPVNRRNYIDGSSDHMSIDAINLLSWSLGCLPLCICMIYVKLLINSRSFLFSYALIPNYALMIALLIIPPIVIRHVRNKQPLTRLLNFPPMDGDQAWRSSSRLFVSLVWFLCVLMNVIFCLQAGLLAAKADRLAFSKTRYSLLFLPVWFTLVALVFFCPISCLVASIISKFGNDTITFSTALVGCCGPCVILPLQIASVLVTLLLDKVLTGFMSAVFIPVMIAGLMFTCCICLACSACFCFKYVQYVFLLNPGF